MAPATRHVGVLAAADVDLEAVSGRQPLRPVKPRAADRLGRKVTSTDRRGVDEYYTYDGLHRLEKAERGTLSGSPYSSITNHTKRQDFGLEALGNWHEYKEDAGPGGQGEWDLEQVRKHNKVNEIDSDDDHLPDPIDPDAVTKGGGQAAWIVPGYDAAGNMLSGPKPTDPTVRQHYEWDAWNRLVAAWVKNDHLGFEILYIYRGVVRKYRPDFLVRLTDGDILVLETKGQDTEQDKVKRRYLDEWTQAVNAHGGFGRWRCAVAKEPGEIRDILDPTEGRG